MEAPPRIEYRVVKTPELVIPASLFAKEQVEQFPQVSANPSTDQVRELLLWVPSVREDQLQCHANLAAIQQLYERNRANGRPDQLEAK